MSNPFLLVLPLFLCAWISGEAKNPSIIHRQSDDQGDWQTYHYIKSDAERLSYRVGDIDHINQGWNITVNPFLGELNTLPQSYNLKIDEEDPKGTDTVCLVGKTPKVQTHSLLQQLAKNSPLTQKLSIHGDFLNTVEKIQHAWIQIGVTGFLKSDLKDSWVVSLNGQHAPFLEKALNQLNQTHESIQILSLHVPKFFHQGLMDGELKLIIDGSQKTGTASIAVDFVCLYLNPEKPESCEFHLKTIDSESGTKLKNIKASYQGLPLKPIRNGVYESQAHYHGLGILEFQKNDYSDRSFCLQTNSHQTIIQKTLSLKPN